jgi:hypothetical protein
MRPSLAEREWVFEPKSQRKEETFSAETMGTADGNPPRLMPLSLPFEALCAALRVALYRAFPCAVGR